MSDSLIDSEGFPIPGIDHLHIRTTRRRLIGIELDVNVGFLLFF